MRARLLIITRQAGPTAVLAASNPASRSGRWGSA